MHHSASTSLLGRLRTLTPRRTGVTFDEALRVAELQASRLADLVGGADHLNAPVIGKLPRIRVVYEAIAVSGMSHWTGTEWLITLSTFDSLPRQRFTLLHEFKHIVDHGSTAVLYVGAGRLSAAEEAERAADYFAGCALVSKRDLKAAWGRGIQRVSALATYFDVSEQAISVRLAQTNLAVPSDPPSRARCARPVRSPTTGSQRFRIAPLSTKRTYA